MRAWPLLPPCIVVLITTAVGFDVSPSRTGRSIIRPRSVFRGAVHGRRTELTRCRGEGKPPRYRSEELVNQIPRFRIGNISAPLTIIDAGNILQSYNPSQASDILFGLAKLGFTAFQFPALPADEEAGVAMLEGLVELKRKWEKKKYHLLTEILFIPTFDPSLVDFDENSEEDIMRRYYIEPLEVLESPSFPLVQVGCLQHWGPCRLMDAIGIHQKLQRRGFIEHLGGIHMDSKQIEACIGEGIQLRSNLIPYSILDRRAENSLVSVAKSSGVSLLLESPSCEGWLDERWFGSPRPDYLDLTKMPPSMQNAFEILRRAGGWEYVQAVGHSVKEVKEKHVDLLSGFPVKHEHITFHWTVAALKREGVEVGSLFAPSYDNPDPLAQYIVRLDEDDIKKLDSIADESNRLFPPQGCIGSWEKEMYKARDESSYFLDMKGKGGRKRSS
eukprot:jgi/Bigna1/128053/aug1.5_g2761